jgi:hypothetical protein
MLLSGLWLGQWRFDDGDYRRAHAAAVQSVTAFDHIRQIGIHLSFSAWLEHQTRIEFSIRPTSLIQLCLGNDRPSKIRVVKVDAGEVGVGQVGVG